MERARRWIGMTARQRKSGIGKKCDKQEEIS
jgi:hypothetical protein